MPSYFITGSSRGLGLGFVKKLAEDSSNIIIASARNPESGELKSLASSHSNIHLVKLDVAKIEEFPPAVTATEKILGDKPLDYLFVNAGVDYQTNNPLIQVNDAKVFAEELHINVIAAVETIRVFIPLLGKDGNAGKAVTMASELGSIEVAAGIPFLSDTYSVTKAAVNMAVRKMGAALKMLGSPVILLLVFPGLVTETELGLALKAYLDKYAPEFPQITIDESVNSTLKVVHEATAEDHIKFLNWKKETRPW